MMVNLMTIRALSDLLSRFRFCSAALARDTRGIAAIEFAMIVPLMLVMIFGTIEISSGVAVDRKVSMVAQTMADLASRYTSVTPTDLNNFTAIANAMMTPYSSTPLVVTVTEVYINPSSGVGRAQWSTNLAVHSVGSTVAVPNALITRDANGNASANQYLIFAEVSYNYKPAVGYVMGKAGVTLSDQTYTRPRQGFCVQYTTTTSTTTTSSACPTS
jgi:Flp pilus assembly protein TadG